MLNSYDMASFVYLKQSQAGVVKSFIVHTDASFQQESGVWQGKRSNEGWVILWNGPDKPSAA